MRKLALLALLPFFASAADVGVSWTQPTSNTDGSTIPASGSGSIASNRIEWGTCSGSAFGTKAGEKVVSPAATNTTVVGLTPGTHCFRAYATNTYGTESAASNVASKVIAPPTPNPPVVTTATIVRLWTGKGPQTVVGQIKLGVVCGEHMRSVWYAVSREDVMLNKAGRKLRPEAIVVAKCDNA